MLLIPSGNPFKCHGRCLVFAAYLQSQLPVNVLTFFFPPNWGMLRRSRCVQIFIQTTIGQSSGITSTLYLLLVDPLHRHPSVLRRNVTKWAVIQAYYRLFGFGFVWCPYMAINVIVHYKEVSPRQFTFGPSPYYLKKNLNAPRPSEHPPVRGKKCQNV